MPSPEDIDMPLNYRHRHNDHAVRFAPAPVASEGLPSMKADGVLRRLEAHWISLKGALGGQWQEFLSAYRDIVGGLPAEPNAEAARLALDRLVRLLSRYEQGRTLLHDTEEPVRVRLLAPASDELADIEVVRQICNRLRTLAQEADQPSPADHGDAACDPTPSNR